MPAGDASDIPSAQAHTVLTPVHTAVRPAGQAQEVAPDCAPGQAVQLALPAADEKEPAGHTLQLPLPGPAQPGWQAHAARLEALAGALEPGGHSMQPGMAP